jgi:hypothetical protein
VEDIDDHCGGRAEASALLASPILDLQLVAGPVLEDHTSVQRYFRYLRVRLRLEAAPYLDDAGPPEYCHASGQQPRAQDKEDCVAPLLFLVGAR